MNSPDDIVLWRIAKPTSRINRDAAGRHLLETSDTIQGSGFSAAVGPKQAQNLARVGLEV